MNNPFVTIMTVVLMLSIHVSADAQQQRPRRPHFNPATPLVHDPVMAKCGDTFYLYSTGWGVSCMSSTDLKTWKMERSVFGRTPPQWATDLISGYNGHTWAPDVIYANGLYHLYYSCSTFGKNHSAIGHATSPTLDSTAVWTDHGMVVESVPGRDAWNAIDPNVVFDDEGTPWMTFGSFWDGIKLFRLDKDMSRPAQPQQWTTIARRGHFRTDSLVTMQPPKNDAIEAPFIFKKNGYYFLLVSWDFCCRGAKSDYKVAMGRSKNVEGPYLDREGRRMDRGGGSILVQGDGHHFSGLGHCAAYTFDGKDYFVAHAYNMEKDGQSELFLRPITWDKDGWPVVKAE